MSEDYDIDELFGEGSDNDSANEQSFAEKRYENIKRFKDKHDITNIKSEALLKRIKDIEDDYLGEFPDIKDIEQVLKSEDKKLKEKIKKKRQTKKKLVAKADDDFTKLIEETRAKAANIKVTKPEKLDKKEENTMDEVIDSFMASQIGVLSIHHEDKNFNYFYLDKPKHYVQFATEFGNLVSGDVLVGLHYTLRGEIMENNIIAITPVKRNNIPKLRPNESIDELLMNYYRIDPDNIVYPIENTVYLDMVVTSTTLFPDFNFDAKLESNHLKLNLITRKQITQDNLINAIIKAIGYVPPKNDALAKSIARRNENNIKKHELVTKEQRILINKLLEIFKQRKDRMVPVPKQNYTEYVKSNSYNELEMSLGSYGEKGRYIPGVSRQSFFDMMERLKKLTGKSPKGITSKVEIDENNVRRIKEEDKPVYYEKKIRDSKNIIDNDEFGWRVSASIETKLKKPEDFTVKTTRERIRYSFVMSDLKCKVDMTEVKTNNQKDFSYEVEVEFMKSASINDVVKAMEEIYLTYRGVDSFSDLDTDKENNEVIVAYNRLFYTDIKSKNMNISSDKLYDDRNKPVNLKVTELIKPSNKWYITVKYDGERRLLFITNSGTYLINPPGDVVRIGEGSSYMSNTLIDGELMTDSSGKHHYYAFDILFLRAIDLRKTGFIKRLAQIPQKSDMKELLDDHNYSIKHYYSGGDLYSNVTKAYKQMTEMGDRSDGIIYQSAGFYKNTDTYKWKPASKMSIDFVAKAIKGSNVQYNLAVAGKKGPVLFKGTKINPANPIVTYKENIDGQIVECKWDNKMKQFRVMRIRTDRDKPNYISVALDVWRDIMEPISHTTVCGDDLVLMRKYHNKLKNTLIKNELEKSRLLDIGTGRGGDLSKFNNAGVQILFAVEPDAKNLTEFTKRLNQFKKMEGFNLEVYSINTIGQNTKVIVDEVGKAVANKSDKIKDKPVTDMSSFFSLTFFFKDEESYQSLLKTITDFIPAGGKFIGTCFDGKRVYEELEKDNDLKGHLYDGNNPYPYEITMVKAKGLTETGDVKLGNEININIGDETAIVKNQNEWLVAFDRLESDLNARGFVKKLDEFMDNGLIYNILPEASKEYSRLNRMFVFRKPNNKKDKKKLEKESENNIDKIKEQFNKEVKIVVEMTEDEKEKEADIEFEESEEYDEY